MSSINAASGTRFYLYFSKQCPHSTRFRQMLVKKPDLEAKFVQLCVDTMPQAKIPRFVRSVPFIVVTDEKGNPVHLTDSHAFAWLRHELDQHAGNFEAYDSSVMSSSLSDSFAFIGGETGGGAAHTFEWIEGHQADLGGGSHNLYTPQEDTYGGGQTRQNVEEDALSKIMAQRTRDLEHFQGTTRKPDEIDFSKPLNQQQFAKQQSNQQQSNRDMAQYTEDARRAEARRAMGAQSRQGIDFSDPNFRAGIQRPAAPHPQQGRGRGMRPVAALTSTAGRGRGGPVGRRLPQNYPRR